MDRILVVDDDPEIARHLSARLSAAGYRVDCASTGRAAVSMAAFGGHDVIVLDRMLPDIDGLSVLRAIRAAKVDRPVLLLTALGAVDERIAGLKAGADDYLPKPFSTEELIARVEALARRTGPRNPAEPLSCGDLTFDPARLVATRGARVLDLRRREVQLLHYLLKQTDRVVTRKMLLEGIWGYQMHHNQNVIDVHMSRLRSKLHGPGEAPLLHTVRGVGYLLSRTTRP